LSHHLQLIKVRLRQAGLLRENTLSHRVSVFFTLSILTGIYLFILWWLSVSIISEKYPLTFSVFFCLAILNYHLKRIDFNFIQTHFPQPKIQLFIEYLFYYLIFSPLLIITKQWLAIALIPVIFFIISQTPRLKISRRSFTSNLRLRIFKNSDYEWISGLRRYQLSFFLLFILALVLTFLPTVSLLLCWLLSIIIILFYAYNEPSILIREQQQNAHAFLYHKTISVLKLSFLTFLVPVTIYAFLHPNDLSKAITVLVICLINPQLAVIRKYQRYNPSINSSGQTLLLVLLQLIIFNPVIILLSVLYTSFAFNSAVKNLKNYCND